MNHVALATHAILDGNTTAWFSDNGTSTKQAKKCFDKPPKAQNAAGHSSQGTNWQARNDK